MALGGADPAQPLAHPLTLDALTLNAADGPRLEASWTYAPALLSRAAVEALAHGFAAALTALVRHAERPDAGGLSLSDVGLLLLGQDEIEGLERGYAGLGRVVDILPLSPLQEGLLFHALYDAGASSDVYTVQLVLTLEGRLDEPCLRAAVDALVARHGVLRTAFVTAGRARPVQLVLHHVAVPWDRLDLTQRSDREAAFADTLARDRQVRLDLARPPVLRCLLVRLGPSSHRLVLTNHHILMDGWSLADPGARADGALRRRR